jgi:hypothetical protein
MLVVGYLQRVDEEYHILGKSVGREIKSEEASLIQDDWGDKPRCGLYFGPSKKRPWRWQTVALADRGAGKPELLRDRDKVPAGIFEAFCQLKRSALCC